MRCVKKPTKTLMMAVLLHDTGKAVTLTSRKKRKLFPNHSSASTQISKNVLRRFSFTGEEMEEIFFLVRNHMILDAIDRLPETRLRRLFLSPYFPNLLELYRADLESGYHNMAGYYHAARAYRAFLRREKMWREGVYA
jgi:CRISPR/Cas system-associated endonuclease Cas3-HD